MENIDKDIKKEFEFYDEKVMSKADEILAEVHDHIIPELDKLYDIAVKTYEETSNLFCLVDALRVWYALVDAHCLEEKLKDILSISVDTNWLFSEPVLAQRKKIESEVAERRQQNSKDDVELPF